MPLVALPVVERLTLAVVTAVPEWHPEYATFEPFPVHAWVVRHPDGALLVDTGIGVDNAVIDEWYRPRITPLGDALGSLELAPSDIAGVVLSHLHFDHCGQQGMLAAPVYVQAAEYEAAQTPRYTVPDWAAIPNDRLRLVGGDEPQPVVRDRRPVRHRVSRRLSRLILGSLHIHGSSCLLYTSAAADDLLCVDLGGRRIIT